MVRNKLQTLFFFVPNFISILQHVLFSAQQDFICVKYKENSRAYYEN